MLFFLLLHIVAFLCIVNVFPSVILSVAAAAVGKKSQIPPNSNVLFISVSMEPHVAQSMALAAEILKVRNKGLNVTMLAYKSSKPVLLKSLTKGEVKLFKHKNESVSPFQRHHINKRMAQSSSDGFPLYLEALVGNYVSEVNYLRKLISTFKPTFAVIDIMAISALDLFDDLHIPYAIFYPYSSLGLFGVGASSAEEDRLALPSFLSADGISTMSRWQRICNLYENFRFRRSMSYVYRIINEQRAAVNLPTHSELFKSYKEHPIIVQTVHGLEYTRKLSPLVRLVGLPVDMTPSEYKKLPSSKGEAQLLGWLRIPDKPLIYMRMDLDTVPAATHLQTIVNGIILAGSRVLLSIRENHLKKMGTTAKGLEEYYRKFAADKAAAEESGNERMSLNEIYNAQNEKVYKKDPRVTPDTFDLVRVVQPEEVSSNFILFGEHNVSVFVTQVDMKSIVDGFTASVPMLMVPLNSERSANAARLLDLGVGIKLQAVHSIEASPEELEQAAVQRSFFSSPLPSFGTAEVEMAIRVLQSQKALSDVRIRMAWLKEVNQLAGAGSEGAAKFIEELLDVGYLHLIPVTRNLGLFAETGADAIIVLLLIFALLVYMVVRVVDRGTELLVGRNDKSSEVVEEIRMHTEQIQELKEKQAVLAESNVCSVDSNTKDAKKEQ